MKKGFLVKWTSPIIGDDSVAILRVEECEVEFDYCVLEVVKTIKGRFHATAFSKTKYFVDKDFCEVMRLSVAFFIDDR